MSRESSPPRWWRLKPQYLRLQGNIDLNGRVSFPPGPHQPKFDPKTGEEGSEFIVIQGENIPSATRTALESAVRDIIENLNDIPH